MSKILSRRDFLNTTLGFSGLVMAGAVDFKKSASLLSFSTLGCPDWPLDQILSFASSNG